MIRAYARVLPTARFSTAHMVVDGSNAFESAKGSSEHYPSTRSDEIVASLPQNCEVCSERRIPVSHVPLASL